MYKHEVVDGGWYIVDGNGNQVFPRETETCSWEFSYEQLSDASADKFGKLMADVLNWDNGRARKLFDVSNLAFPETEGDLSFHTKGDSDPVVLTTNQLLYIKELLQQLPFIENIEQPNNTLTLWDVNAANLGFLEDIDEEEIEMFLYYFTAQVIEALGFEYDIY